MIFRSRNAARALRVSRDSLPIPVGEVWIAGMGIGVMPCLAFMYRKGMNRARRVLIGTIPVASGKGRRVVLGLRLSASNPGFLMALAARPLASKYALAC